MTITTIGDRAGADFAGCEDTQIREAFNTTNYGTLTGFTLATNSGDIYFDLIKFSGLSNITGPVTVSAVNLSLRQVAGSAGSGRNLNLRRCLRNWVETEATWNIYSTGNNWGTAGGINASDRSSTVSGSVGLDDRNDFYSIALNAAGIADVEGWINGSLSNFGWHIGLDDESVATLNWQILSSEDTQGGNTLRPLLTVTHTAAGGGLSIPVAMHQYRRQRK